MATPDINETEAAIKTCVQILLKVLKLQLHDNDSIQLSHVEHNSEHIYPLNSLIKIQHTLKIVYEEIISGELNKNTTQSQPPTDMWSNQGLFSELSYDKYGGSNSLWGNNNLWGQDSTNNGIPSNLLEPPLLKIEPVAPALPLDDSQGPLDDSQGPLDDSLDDSQFISQINQFGHKQEIVV